jgi:hypothetical protein
MPPVGFEPPIPVFERTKTVHALDRAVTVFGKVLPISFKLWDIFLLKGMSTELDLFAALQITS